MALLAVNDVIYNVAMKFVQPIDGSIDHAYIKLRMSTLMGQIRCCKASRPWETNIERIALRHTLFTRI